MDPPGPLSEQGRSRRGRASGHLLAAVMTTLHPVPLQHCLRCQSQAVVSKPAVKEQGPAAGRATPGPSLPAGLRSTPRKTPGS